MKMDNGKSSILPICDLHIHVVPGVDDGAVDEDMAMEMLDCAYAQGARRTFCTSHSWTDTWTHTWQGMTERDAYVTAFERVKERLASVHPDYELYTGNEVFCEKENIDQVMDLLTTGNLFTLNGTKYVLTELSPRVKRPEADGMVHRLLSAGFIPVLAHVERYRYLNEEDMNAFTKEGCLLQINLYSMAEEGCEPIRQKAQQYVRDRLVSFVGTDAHGMDHRPPRITAGVDKIRALTDEVYCRAICFGNAERLLTGETASVAASN